MEDLKLPCLSDLVDLLVEQTSKHVHLRRSGATSQQMMASRQILRSLQAEIKLKKDGVKPEQPSLSTQDESPFVMAS